MSADSGEKRDWDWAWLWTRGRGEWGLGVLAFTGFYLFGRWIGPSQVGSAGASQLLSVCLVFGGSHALAVCFHYLPKGIDNGLVRLSLAAFCRTFVPLLALISIHNYIFPLLDEANAGSIIVAYLISLALTLLAVTLLAPPQAID